MKQFLFSMITILVIFSLAVWNACFLDATTRELLSAESVGEIRDLWGKYEKVYNLTHRASDLQAVSVAISEMEAAEKAGSEQNFHLAHARLKESVENLRQNSVFSFEALI